MERRPEQIVVVASLSSSRECNPTNRSLLCVRRIACNVVRARAHAEKWVTRDARAIRRRRRALAQSITAIVRRTAERFTHDSQRRRQRQRRLVAAACVCAAHTLATGLPWNSLGAMQQRVACVGNAQHTATVGSTTGNHRGASVALSSMLHICTLQQRSQV